MYMNFPCLICNALTKKHKWKSISFIFLEFGISGSSQSQGICVLNFLEKVHPLNFEILNEQTNISRVIKCLHDLVTKGSENLMHRWSKLRSSQAKKALSLPAPSLPNYLQNMWRNNVINRFGWYVFFDNKVYIHVIKEDECFHSELKQDENRTWILTFCYNSLSFWYILITQLEFRFHQVQISSCWRSCHHRVRA